MNHHHRSHTRRQWRRLPHVHRPPRPRPLTFWLSLRGAAQWLRKHQEIIETAVGLLEMYPSLIQETALDALWDFMAPFLNIYVENRESSRHAPLVKGRQTEQRKTGGTSAPKHSPTRLVPAISITHDASEDENDPDDELPRHLQGGHDDDESDADVRTSHVYVCVQASGPGHDAQLYLQVIDAIVRDFFVKSGPEDGSGEPVFRDSAREKNLSQASACVFVLDEASLNAPECLNDLSAAWALDLPMVFVKNSSFTIPTPLPDLVLQHSLGLGDSPAASRASTPAFSARQGSVSPIPPGGSARSRGRLRKRRSFPSLHPAWSCRHVWERPTRSAKRETRMEMKEADVVLALLDGYRHALVFEEAKRDACASALRQLLHSLLDPPASNATGHVMATLHNSSPLHAEGDSPSRQGSKFLSVPDFRSSDSPASEPTPKSDSVFHHNVDAGTCLTLSSKSASCLSLDSASPLPSSELITPGRDVPSPKNRPSSHPRRSNRSNSRQAVVNVGSTHRHADPNHHLTSRSFTHLQQVQKRIQQERTKFLTSLVNEVGDHSSPDSPDALAHETVYMVCKKDKYTPGCEPRLVKWPPDDGQQGEPPDLGNLCDNIYDLFSDSPTNFQELDLSILVNMRNGTPDSDNSIIF